jgi:NodT family efflux transporter outer membrane factor (OMF) lipoprotein
MRRVAWSRAQLYAAVAAVILTLPLAECAVGPDYVPEAAPVPPKFKEMKGWKVATPGDGLDRGDWWAPYRDPKLDLLIRQVEISNQTVAASAAGYEEAKALIREAQASLFPQLTGNYSYTRTRTGPLANSLGTSAPRPIIYTTTYTGQVSGPGSVVWDIDVWGKVRRQIESNVSEAQASSADLDNAKLSAQGQLALAYFNLRAADSLRALLTRTVAEYKRTLAITQNQFNSGIVSRADVITAQNQLLNTEAQMINVGVQRAQFEHAIAVLTGRPPAELTIAPAGLAAGIPRFPITVPSELLERRPDIAAAERTMQQQNALIGVQVAGFFPTINLTGSLQYIGHTPLPFDVPHQIWSLGGSAAQTLFDGGSVSAQVDAARATYWQSVATYRQTVLTAFQQVEDNLAAIRIYREQLGVLLQAVKAAREAVDVYLNQYRAGTVAFTTVVVAQATLLADEEAALTVRQNMFLASVTLIEALGGGWDTTLLPTRSELEKGFSLFPKLESAPPPLEPLPVESLPPPAPPAAH